MVSLITTGTQSPSELLCLSLRHTHTHTYTAVGITFHPSRDDSRSVDRSAGTVGVKSAKHQKSDLQLQRNAEHLVGKRRAVRGRHRRLTAWLHGGSQLLVIPGTERSHYHFAHIS